MNTVKSKNFLIFTSDTGFGHRSAAKAIAAALEAGYGDAAHIDVVNAFDHKSVPPAMRDEQVAYDRRVRQQPQLYQFGYQVMDTAWATSLAEIGLTAVLFRALTDILKQLEPDVIIVTHPMYLEPLDAVFRKMGRVIPVLTVVTDLGTVQRLWFNSVSQVTVVPTERVYELATQVKLPSESIRITGIPVHPKHITEQRTAVEMRTALGLEPTRMTALVVGSPRVSNLLNAVRVLNHCNFPIQAIVVAGGDDEVYAELQTIEWHIPAVTYNLVDTMPALMRAADFIVCKAGGLIVTEALACGLPTLLIDIIEGQETGNAEFVVANQAGAVAKTPLDMLETLFHWLSDDGQALQDLTQNARRVGRPHAAAEIAELAWALLPANA